MQELSAAFDKLQNEKIQMERKLEVLAEKIEEYRADEDNMRAAILDARKLGSSIVKDAQRQADEIIADANAQSAKVIDSIQTRAEREKMNLSHLQKEVATFKNQLLALYKNHLELISSLPENTKPEESAPSGQKEKASAEQEVYPKEEKIRLVLDNLKVHSSVETRKYLATVPGRFEFVFTPKQGSWLNLVEGFFSKMTRQMLKGIRVKTKDELVERIYKYFEEANEEPVVYHWKYKLDEIDPNEEVQVETLPLEKSS